MEVCATKRIRSIGYGQRYVRIDETYRKTNRSLLCPVKDGGRVFVGKITQSSRDNSVPCFCVPTGVRPSRSTAVCPCRLDSHTYETKLWRDVVPRHRNLARFVCEWTHEQGSSLFHVVLLHAPPVTLDGVVERYDLSEESCGRIAAGLFEGLGCLHGLGLVHRDLRPCNVFIRGTDQPLIAGLGRAYHPQHPLPRRIARSADKGFMAPECFWPEARVPSPTQDLWSVGMLVAYAATGQSWISPVAHDNDRACAHFRICQWVHDYRTMGLDLPACRGPCCRVSALRQGADTCLGVLRRRAGAPGGRLGFEQTLLGFQADYPFLWETVVSRVLCACPARRSVRSGTAEDADHEGAVRMLLCDEILE